MATGVSRTGLGATQTPQRKATGVPRPVRQALSTAQETFQQLPLMGVTPQQVTQGTQAFSDIFRRPQAAATALSVTPLGGEGVTTGQVLRENIPTFGKQALKGFMQPEQFPRELQTEALMDAGLEPVSAASLATLGQFGLQLALSRLIAGGITKGKTSLLNKTVKNIDKALVEAEARGADLTKLKAADLKLNTRDLAKQKDVSEVVDLYLKSKGLKVLPKALEFKPVTPTTQAPILPAPPTTPITPDVIPIPTQPTEPIPQGVARGAELLTPKIATKQAIKELTGINKTVNEIVTNEAKQLRLKLGAEAKGAKIGQAAGKKEIRLLEKSKRDINKVVKSINSLMGRRIPPEFADQRDALAAQFGLNFKKLPLKAPAKMREFIQTLRDKGEEILIPEERLAALDRMELGNLTLSGITQIKEVLGQIVHTGQIQGKLIAGEKERNFQEVKDRVVAQIRKTGRIEATPTATTDPLISARRTRIQGIGKVVDGFFSSARKTEAIADTLDGNKIGAVHSNIIQPIQSAGNAETVKHAQMAEKLSKAIEPLSKDFKNMITKKVNIVGVEMTKENAIMIALNAGNEGNIQRLVRGNNLTEKQIANVVRSLAPQEKKFVRDIFDLVGSQFNSSKEVLAKLTGGRLGKVEGDYFPIIEDGDLSPIARLREAEKDLFQDIVNRTFVEKGFTKSRVGGVGPVNLTFESIFSHLKDVVHFNTHALAVRDVQKLIQSPEFRDSVSRTLSPGVFEQFPAWLRDVANPRSGVLNKPEKFVNALRNNATVFTLGGKFVVSLLQGGSITQTIDELGIAPVMVAATQMLMNPMKAIRFMKDKSVEMQFRTNNFDRELKDLINSREVKKLIKGKPGASELLFGMIKGIDFMTTGTSWLAAYNKAISKNPLDDVGAVTFADRVIRLTQPQGAVKDLAQISRGGAFQKLFTSFYSHFSNVHNRVVRMMDRLKMGEEHPLRKARDFAFSFFWILMAPAVIATILRSGGKSLTDIKRFKKDFAKEFVSYAGGTLPVIRDVARAVASPIGGGKISGPPGLRGLEFFSRAITAKKLPTKLKNAGKAFGALTGTIPEQAFITAEGLIDIATGETQDIRRLFLSEFSLKGTTKKSKKGTKRRRGGGVSRPR